MAHNILILPGDGIGQEVCQQVEKFITYLDRNGVGLNYEFDDVGGTSYDKSGTPIDSSTLSLAKNSDAVLFGAVGGPKWDGVAYDLRPEAALLSLRKELGLFANLRPAICFSSLVAKSSLKPELVSGLDILVVRELTGGVYFGEPKELVTLETGERRAIDSQIYHEHEIERIAKVAFDLASLRSGKISSVDKHNVMKSGVLWRDVVSNFHGRHGGDYGTSIDLSHMLADNCAMQLVRYPKQFDVILTDNLFGDILSDIAAQLTGSLGMLPSASLGAEFEVDGVVRRRALYEPVHGSAPDIQGQFIANPIAMVSSFSMLLHYSLSRTDLAVNLNKAIELTLEQGYLTKDLSSSGGNFVSTGQMADQILANFDIVNQAG